MKKKLINAVSVLVITVFAVTVLNVQPETEQTTNKDVIVNTPIIQLLSTGGGGTGAF